MSAGLFGFLFNTLRTRANDPANKQFWLPGALQNMDKPNTNVKALPLQETDWNLGAIQGEGGSTIAGSIKSVWWGLVEKMVTFDRVQINLDDYLPIVTPDHPDPVLDMPTVTIIGLDNVWVLDNPRIEQPGDGYHTTVAMQFGYYEGQKGLPSLPQISLQGTYSLTQSVSAANKSDPSKVTDTKITLQNIDWPTQVINGTGNFVMNITHMQLNCDVNITVSGRGGNRTANAEVTKLAITGTDGQALPDLALNPDKLTINTALSGLEGFMKGFVQEAFGNVATHKSIIENLVRVLNMPENLIQLSSMLTKQLNLAVNDTLSPVASGQLPTDEGQQAKNPVDQYLFDRVRYAFNNESSEYYLPKVIFRSTSPQLEPYTTNVVSLGAASQDGITLDNIQLQDLKIVGLSNMLAPADKLVFKPYVMDATLNVGTLNNPPQVLVKRNGQSVTEKVPKPPLTITGTFSCEPAGMGQTLTSNFTIKVITPSVAATLKTEGEALSSLVLTFTSVSLGAELSNISIDVSLDSVFKAMIQKVLNGDTIKTQALKGINEKLVNDLSSISKQATEITKQLVEKQLGG